MEPFQALFKKWRVELAHTLLQEENPLQPAKFGKAMQLAALMLGGQAVLAEQIGESQPTISQYCRGKVPRNKKYAAYLIKEKLPKILVRIE